MTRISMGSKANIDLNAFLDWASEKPKSRSVTIKIARPGRYPATRAVQKHDLEIEIWVYDYTLETGQFVKSVDEIDLERHKKEEDMRTLQELKKKYDN